MPPPSPAIKSAPAPRKPSLPLPRGGGPSDLERGLGELQGEVDALRDRLQPPAAQPAEEF